jgi:hypothetical protein
MAQFIGGEVTLNGATWVEVVAAPASGKQRQVLSVLTKNKDSVAHVFQVRKKKSATLYELLDGTVDAGRCGQLVSNCIVLDATDESVEVKYEATATTTESVADVAVFEV